MNPNQQSGIFALDMDYHINRLDFMPIRCSRQLRQNDIIMGNIDKLIIFGFLKMVMMIGVGVKQAVVIMNHHPTKQASIGKLVQCIINRAARHMQTSGGDFFGQAICRHMAMTAIKKQGGNRNPLARWPQAGKAQFFGKMPL